MSFWPFNSNNSESKIDSIIKSYIDTLHQLENGNSTEETTIKRRQYSNCTTHRSLSPVFSAHSIASDDDDVQTHLSHLHVADPRGIINVRDQRSNRSSFSSLFKNNDTDSKLNLPTDIEKLNSKFIEKILNEPTLVDRLIRQDEKVLDFICFGYFYSKQDNDNWIQIYHIDYLIDVMLLNLDFMEGSYPFDNMSSHKDLYEDDILNEEPINIEEEKPVKENTGSHVAILDKYTQILRISDLIVLNIPIIYRTILEYPDRMVKLWSLIHHPKITTENSIQLTIFLKIQDGLLANHKNSYLNFIRSQQDILLHDIFEHDNLPVIFDFLLRLICTDKKDDSTGILDLLEGQRLIDKCLQYFHNNIYSDRKKNTVFDFLKQFIEISVNIPINDISIGPNNLVRSLVSESTVETLIHLMLKQKGNTLCNIVVIVIELIRKNNSDFDPIVLTDTTLHKNPPNKRDPIFLGNLLKSFTKHMPELLQLIWDIDSLENGNFTTQIGEHYSNVGLIRIKIIELIAELLHCSNMESMNSKLSERIADSRDHFRDNVTHEINILIDDNSTEVSNSTITPAIQNNSEVFQTSLISGPIITSPSNADFYISSTNNDFLRKQATIGDSFKCMLFDSDVIPKLLQIFLDHPWNNFWHNVMFDIIQQLLNGKLNTTFNPFLIYSIFNLEDSRKFKPIQQLGGNLEQFNILDDFILVGYKRSYQYYLENSMTFGYSGHILLIAEDLAAFSNASDINKISPVMYSVLQEPKWIRLSEEILPTTKTMCIKILGGGERIEDQNGNVILQIYEKDPVQERIEEAPKDTHSKESDSKLKNNELSYPTQSDLIKKIGDLW